MTNEPPRWDYDPVPTAARDARIAEALLSWGRGDADATLRVVQDVRDRDDVAELVMGAFKIYWRDIDASIGRELAIARLEGVIRDGRAEALGEAS